MFWKKVKSVDQKSVYSRRKISQPIPIRIVIAIGITGVLNLIIAYFFLGIYSCFGGLISIRNAPQNPQNVMDPTYHVSREKCFISE
ncbi:MAG: hypothetical protein NWE77_05255 [Candidatus Bathyarchaeota archaeon]|nr:hypothetical protein [Candidatus Bathyarchaeota archaeon]